VEHHEVYEPHEAHIDLTLRGILKEKNDNFARIEVFMAANIKIML
jgi:hypothetical protein